MKGGDPLIAGLALTLTTRPTLDGAVMPFSTYTHADFGANAVPMFRQELLVWCVGRSKAFPGRGGRGSPGTKIRRFVHKGWNGLGTVPRGGNARAGTVPRGGNARAGTVPRGGTEPNPFHPLGTNRRIVV